MCIWISKKSNGRWRHCDVIQVFFKQLSISWTLLNLQTSYLVTLHNIRYIWWFNWKWPWQMLKVTGEGQRSQKKKWSCLVNVYNQTYLVSRYSTIHNVYWQKLSWPWHKAKVTSHRRGGVCVLWMLLAWYLLSQWLKPVRFLFIILLVL